MGVSCARPTTFLPHSFFSQTQVRRPENAGNCPPSGEVVCYTLFDPADPYSGPTAYTCTDFLVVFDNHIGAVSELEQFRQSGVCD